MRSILRTHADLDVLASTEIEIPRDPIVKNAARQASTTPKVCKNPELNSAKREHKPRSKNQTTAARKACTAVVAGSRGRKPIIVHPRAVECGRCEDRATSGHPPGAPLYTSYRRGCQSRMQTRVCENSNPSHQTSAQPSSWADRDEAECLAAEGTRT